MFPGLPYPPVSTNIPILVLSINSHIFLYFTVVDDRRRAGGGRREDPRRHTLGTDMLGYGPGQLPPQRAMDLEVKRH